MKRLFLAAFVVACPPSPAETPHEVSMVVCPEGSMFDSASGFCRAVPAPQIATPADARIDGGAAKDASASPSLRPKPSGNVLISCDFPDGWVSLLPVAAYPKDDSFLMQTLIGLTEDPSFWRTASGATALQPYAAQRCNLGGAGFNVSAGDYWLLAGQANTFGSKGKYDKNGVRRRVTVSAVLGIDLKASDLTHTWLCISCPWIVIEGLAPFPILRFREEEGTDVVPVRVPVRDGRLRLRVIERENETTWLDMLRVRAGGRSIAPALGGERSALAAADGAVVMLERGTEIRVDYTLPDTASADIEIVATGHYETHAKIPEKQPLYVVDLHVDLGYATYARKTHLEDPAFDVSIGRLAKGAIGTLVVPLFVEDAWAMKPAAARAAYEATWDALQSANIPVPVWISFEGADGFSDDPSLADVWIARGAWLFGLVHSRSNALGGASQDPNPAARARGLTPAGAALAEHLVKKGALLDVAHASDKTFDDLAKVAEKYGFPLVDSHTGMRALHDIPRNLDDDRAKKIAASGGIIGLSMHAGHLAGPEATLDDYIAHLEHAIEIAGEDHVAIGSDLAGGITPPKDADGAATWPALQARLRARGWSEERLAAAFHKNAERVFRFSLVHR